MKCNVMLCNGFMFRNDRPELLASRGADRLMATAPGEAATACAERLRRIRGVRDVLCFDESTGSRIDHPGLGGTAPQADALVALLSRCRKLFDSSDALLYVSMRTRLDVEYTVAPDSDAGSGLALVVVQGASDPPASTAPLYTSVLQMLATATPDWLYGLADE